MSLNMFSICSIFMFFNEYFKILYCILYYSMFFFFLLHKDPGYGYYMLAKATNHNYETISLLVNI